MFFFNLSNAKSGSSGFLRLISMTGQKKNVSHIPSCLVSIHFVCNTELSTMKLSARSAVYGLDLSKEMYEVKISEIDHYGKFRVWRARQGV